MNDLRFIFHTDGTYIGYIDENYFFSRDGNYLGWLENDGSVYDKLGKYRGRLSLIGSNYYILKNRFILDPMPKPPINIPPRHSPIPPQGAVSAVRPEFGLEDSFHVWGVS